MKYLSTTDNTLKNLTAQPHCMLHQKGGGADVLRMRSMLQGQKVVNHMASLAPLSYTLAAVMVGIQWIRSWHIMLGMLISESWDPDLIFQIHHSLTAEVELAHAASLCA